MYTERYKRAACLLLSVFLWGKGMAQQPLRFSMETLHDSLSWLCLLPADRTEGEPAGNGRKPAGMKAVARWRLDYPVYRLATGDVDGDGKDEALVGVIKPTRFYPQPARRLFLFKQVNGKIRPMWMGSRLGGILCDFRFVRPYVRTLQSTTDGKYVVADYAWDDFGLTFVRFMTGAVSRKEAAEKFASGEPEEAF